MRGSRSNPRLPESCASSPSATSIPLTSISSLRLWCGFSPIPRYFRARKRTRDSGSSSSVSWKIQLKKKRSLSELRHPVRARYRSPAGCRSHACRLVRAATVVAMAVRLTETILDSSLVQYRVLKDAAAKMAYSSNIYFSRAKWNYFFSGVPPNPLIHIWSMTRRPQFDPTAFPPPTISGWKE
jgi:hypothetical protein